MKDVIESMKSQIGNDSYRPSVFIISIGKRKMNRLIRRGKLNLYNKITLLYDKLKVKNS